MMNVIDMLKKDEGYSSTPYIDSLGFPTIGHGQRIGTKNASLSMYTFEVDEVVAQAWLRASLNEKIEHCKAFKRVELALLNGFKKFLGAVIDHDWQLAHDEMLDSLWARQVPNRANRMAAMMLSNDWDSYYLKI
jgi:lysozyme